MCYTFDSVSFVEQCSAELMNVNIWYYGFRNSFWGGLFFNKKAFNMHFAKKVLCIIDEWDDNVCLKYNGNYNFRMWNIYIVSERNPEGDGSTIISVGRLAPFHGSFTLT